jgi:hypothetical protein
MDWFYDLPVLKMGVAVFATAYVITQGIYAVVTSVAERRAARAFKSLSAGILSPLGTVFGLFVAFLAVQVWGDSQRAFDAVNREASALRAVVLLATAFPEPVQEQMRTLLRRQIQDSVALEWPAMARGSATLTIAPLPLVGALRLALALTPQREGQTIAQREMVRALEDALDARRQRIAISHSAINGVKWFGLSVEGILTLLAIAMVHSDNRPAAALAMGTFATAAATAVLLIASHARPFAGEISVKPDLLLQVLPEERSSLSVP